MEVNKNVTYEQLSEKLQAKYHRRLVLQFKDADGDQVVLDSEAALKRALLSARNNTVLLFLEDRGDLMQHGAQSMRASATGAPALELSPTSSPQRKRRPPQLEEASVHGGGSAVLDFQQSPKRNFSDAGAGAIPAAAASVTPPSSPLAKNWMSGIEQLTTIDRARHLEQVRNNVGLSQEQVEKLRETFLKLSDGEGHVNRYKFSEGLKSLGITNELLIEQNWNAFDDDRDGRVSIAEFLAAIAIMSHGTLQQKLRFVFNMYDADGNGTLDKEELLQIFRVSTSLKGEYVPLPQLRRMVEDTLREIDLNGDGKLDFPEFELAIQRNQLEVNTRVAFV